MARMNGKTIFRKALKDSLPVMMGYVTMGFAAGVVFAVKCNICLAPLWSAFLAATAVSGTIQFAITQPIADGASLVSVAILTLLINFRYGLYGFSMLTRWRGIPFIKKFFLINCLADEAFALQVSCKYDDPNDNLKYCLWIAALDTSYWIAGTTLGAICGGALPFPSKGIEFTMTALFIVILTDQIRDMIAKRRLI